MVEDNSNGSAPTVTALPAIAQPKRRRVSLPLIFLAILLVVVPFLTWYLTWFGRPLSDDDIGRYLRDEKNVRHVQQALTQVEERIEKGDGSVKRWYQQVAALAASPVVEIRKTAAWVMGQDNQSEEFHAGLLKLMEDAQPVVRRNAAVQLARFKDARGRAELLAMLQPFNVTAQAEGKISSVLTEGVEVRENAMLARITDTQNRVQELRSPLSGKLTHVSAPVGANVAAGAVILTLAPDPEFVFEALRALFLVGEAEDLPEVERYARGVEGMPEQVKKQATETMKEIRRRSEQKEAEVKR